MGNFGSLPWLSEKYHDSEKLVFVPGLQNLGNNCFLNVILQAMASCLCYREYLQKIIEECQALTGEEHEVPPLMVALGALLDDLCMTTNERVVLNPRNLMLAVHLYIPKFNLSSQQDAAEALLHVLSSLREEFSESYAPQCGSLADVSTISSYRILDASMSDKQMELRRWQELYMGPFDGILGSVLTCRSCSYQIVMDFELFHSLSLPLVPSCKLEDCLRQYLGSEKIENYKCSRCWHIAAVKYLSAVDHNEPDVTKLKSCSGEDFCDCRNLSSVKTLPIGNGVSRIFKQLSITRFPKILCIHLQRSTVDAFGEPIKLEGHISFPFSLTISPSFTFGIDVGQFRDISLSGPVAELKKNPLSLPGLVNMNFDSEMLTRIYKLSGRSVYSEECGPEKSNCLDDYSVKFLDGEEGDSAPTAGSLDAMTLQSNIKVCTSKQLSPAETPIYHLVSVVEHFGRDGSGHYTVYRKVSVQSDNEPDGATHAKGSDQWFFISDSEVHCVEEKEVLAAEASLLFYERKARG